MLLTMKEILDRASKEGYAVAAPNVDNELNARACIEAAEEKNAPLILDVAYSMTADINLLGKILRDLAIQSKVPVAINLDHGATKEQVVRAIQSGFTSVMFDRSAKPFDENVKEVKEIVDIAHLIGVSVEAELGHVGQADNYANDRDAALTSPAEAVDYINKTGVDCLAVAIGTAHGAYPKGFTPYLDFDRLVEIKKAVNGLPLVLHGSSGTNEEDIKKACQLGINKVNIANDLCRAAVDAVKDGNFDGNKAYDVYDAILVGVKNKLMHMIDVYGSTGKAWEVSPKGIPAKVLGGRE